MTIDHTSKAATAGRGRVLNIAFWVIQILFAAYFLWFYVIPKFTGDTYWIDLFGQIGIGQWFRYVTGIVEVIGAVGLLIPRLFIVDDPGAAVPALIVFVVAVVIAWVRWPDTRALFGRLRR
jgi:putative oxidoreductase